MPPTAAGNPFQITINVAGRLDDSDQFADVVLKTGNAGEIARLRDVGRVELGAQTYAQSFALDGKAAAGMAIFQAPGANALDVAERSPDRRRPLHRARADDLRSARRG